MFEYVRADTMRVIHRRRAVHAIDILRFLWEDCGLQTLVIYRFGRWLGSMRKHRYGRAIVTPLRPVYWILSICVRKAYGIDLDQSADIAPGLCIVHFGGIEVRNCRIGSGCIIHQQAKLVGLSETSSGGLVIGEGVYIGPHAQICADIYIGDGATIGAGAVVTQDIPPHCLVLGNPGRIISQRDYDNRALL